MKTYLVVTGVVFALIVAVHVARVVTEGVQIAADPLFDFSSVLALGLCVWAALVYRRV